MLGQLQDAGNTTTLAHYLERLAGAGGQGLASTAVPAGQADFACTTNSISQSRTFSRRKTWSMVFDVLAGSISR